MAGIEAADPGRLREDLDGLGDRAFLSLDILARALHVKNAELQPTLLAIVAAAVSTLGTAQHAGLITVVRGTMIPQATTGRPPQLLDELQQRLKDGPCIGAAERQVLIRVDDTSRDDRWPDFAAQAQSLGVRSMLCVPLRAHEQCLGTLSMYSDRDAAFTEQDERITALFATLAAIALAEAQRTEQLQTALANRDVIGQAKGILMERHRLPAEAAFRALSQASQDANVKLTEVARHLAETGELPSDANEGRALAQGRAD